MTLSLADRKTVSHVDARAPTPSYLRYCLTWPKSPDSFRQLYGEMQPDCGGCQSQRQSNKNCQSQRQTQQVSHPLESRAQGCKPLRRQPRRSQKFRQRQNTSTQHQHAHQRQDKRQQTGPQHRCQLPRKGHSALDRQSHESQSPQSPQTRQVQQQHEKPEPEPRSQRQSIEIENSHRGRVAYFKAPYPKKHTHTLVVVQFHSVQVQYVTCTSYPLWGL